MIIVVDVERMKHIIFGFNTACVVSDVRFDLNVWPTNWLLRWPWRIAGNFTIPYEEFRVKWKAPSNWIETDIAVHTWHHITAEKETSLCNKSFTKYKQTLIAMLRYKFSPSVMKVMETSNDCRF